MNNSYRLLWRLILCIAIVSSSALLSAQATEDEDEDTDEDIVMLSPFEVTSTSNVGYLATDTLAGTRIRTDLKDVGAAISVVTKEMMEDVGATDNETLLQYTTSSEVAGTQGTFGGMGNGATVDESARLLAPNTVNRVRGLSAAENTRDFFVSDIPWDGYNVERVDIQRGPNSILFGLGKPAGLINKSMDNAEFVNSGEVALRFGSYGSKRANFDFNQVIIDDTLAVRVEGVLDHAKFKQEPAFENDERTYIALRYEPKLIKAPGNRTSIKVKFENGRINANRPRTVTPMDSVSPWFRPTAVSASNPFGGANKAMGSNPYDAFDELFDSGDPLYSAWLDGGGTNAQQPLMLVDGASGEILSGRAGWINNGARNEDGAIKGIADGLEGRRYPTPFMGIRTLNGAANDLGLPNASYGQYRAQSMTDPSIFDFYNNLIDGPNANEWEDFQAWNVDVSQTFWNDRIGLQANYDRQNYERGGQTLLGWQPKIQIDLLQSWDDLSSNNNAGRPYVMSNAGGDGRSFETKREYKRFSAFFELRASDFMDSDRFFTKLLGKHRFNVVNSDENYKNENLSWINQANGQTWAGFWNVNDGSSSAFYDRVPLYAIYLGGSIANQSTAAGANIPGIQGKIELPDTQDVLVFDTTWNASGVAFDDLWDVPASLLGTMFSEDPPNPPPAGSPEGSPNVYYQNSNPANYVGWRNYSINMMNYDRGADRRLTRRAQLGQRETSSQSASWQAYWWDGAIVTTIGYREDEVKSRGYTAWADTSNRAILDLSSDSYRLPSTYEPDRILKDESTSGGIVVHVNKLLPDDVLPINVSLTYNESSNFEVGDVRNDLYGNPIANPSGSTKDYGILLTTKDGRFSFRAIKYEAEVLLDNSSLDSYGIGDTIRNGLNWRNVFLYQLTGYDWGTRHGDSYRNRINNAYPEFRPDGPDGDATEVPTQAGYDYEDAMINGWNEIQAWLDERGFFEAWNMNPVNVADLVDRTTYLSNPAAYAPSDTSQVYAYTATAPQNFAVTADTLSKGYEFELTANPSPNWRIAFNASKAEAFRNNVGGTLMNEFVAYMDSMLLGTPAGGIPRWGGAGNRVELVYQAWRANYVRLNLQEGTAVPELREWRYNLITNYSFTEGRLDGVGVGGSYRWQDEVAIGYPLVPEGNTYSFDINSPIMGPSEDALDLWVSYERPLTEKIDWKIQLNVRNAFAGNSLIPISVEPDANATWASVRIAPAQEWFLTSTFKF